METQLLRTFAAVADAGSISAAALSLGYVQSSVSEQVRRLEAELGVALLTRTSAGVHLTDEGRALLPQAERVLAAEEGLRRAAAGPARLRLGAVDTLAVRWLPAVLAALPAGERPVVSMGRRDHLVRDVARRTSDVAVLYRPAGAPLPGPAAAGAGLDVEVLDSDELLVVRAPSGGQGWLVTQPGCVHREAFDRHVMPRLPGVRVEAEASTPDTLRQLARQGAGRAILPRLAVAEDLASGALVVDSDAPETGGAIEIVAVTPRDARPEVHRLLRRAVDHASSA